MRNHGVLFKMVLSTAVSIAAFIGLGVYGIANNAATFASVRQLYGTAGERRESSQRLGDPLQLLRQLSLCVVMAPNSKLQEQFNEQQLVLAKQIDEAFANWRSIQNDPRIDAAFLKFRESWDRYKMLKDVTIDKAMRRYREEAFLNATGAELQQFDAMNVDRRNWIQVRGEVSENAYRAINEQYSQVFWVSTVVVSLLVVLVGGLGIWTIRSVIRPILTLQNAAARIAKRESIGTIAVSSADELGALARDMERMAAEIQAYNAQERNARVRIEELLAAVRSAVGRLSTVSMEILAAATQQAAGAQQQASAVTETTATVAEVTHTSAQAAELADTVCVSAKRAADVSKSGRAAIEATIAAMQTVGKQMESIAVNTLTLAERAQDIGEIIDAVNEIADQTNLLALNAAIEASRAGEYGKGFSVVAAEVKDLAEQSKKATKQIQHMLREIQDATNRAVLSVEQGNKSVDSTSAIVSNADATIDSLAKIVACSAQSASQIAAAANQQAIGMNQINEAIHSIDRAARQSLTSTNETQQAARDINALGLELKLLFDDDFDHSATQKKSSDIARFGS